MSLLDFFRDTKNILLGNTENDYQTDFKEELENAVKEGLISKAEAATLIQSRKNIKAEAMEMDKKQISSIVLEDGSVSSIEDAEKKKKEIERKKREKEAQKRSELENINSTNLQNTQTVTLEDGSVVSVEEAKKKKMEIERKKRIKEAQRRAALENANKVNSENTQPIKEERKVISNNKITSEQNSKVKIDRNRIMKEIENEEREEKNIVKKDIERDGKY